MAVVQGAAVPKVAEESLQPWGRANNFRAGTNPHIKSSKKSSSGTVGPEARKPCWRKDRAQEAAFAAL